MAGFVDTHCHLDHRDDATAAEQVARARDAGVSLMITVGTDVASSRQCIATAAAHDDVLAVVGIHPNDAGDATPEALAEIRAMATAPNVVGIGETGLDHYRDWAEPADQEASFRAHIQMCKDLDRTLVIHCRDAWPECIRVLDDAGAPDRVVMHCYSGDATTTEACIANGWFMSFAGNVTFKNADDLRLAATTAPAGLLLTETDSPYLTPVPKRGRPNEPGYVGHTVAFLAELRGQDPAALTEVLHANTVRAFALDRVLVDV